MSASKINDTLEKLVQYSKGDFTKDDLEEVRKFVFDISHVVNKKIAALEDDKQIDIKLPPLQKQIPTRKNNRTFMSMPITGVASYNTGVHGSFTYPTTVNISPGLGFGPYMLDPLGNSGETIIDRINKIKKYIRIYNQVKTDLLTNKPDDYYVRRPTGWGDYTHIFSGLPDQMPTTTDLDDAEKNFKPSKK